MNIYLAARYSRRLELAGYAEELRQCGFIVTSRWLNGDHQISDGGVPVGEDGEALVEGGRDSLEAATLRARFAVDDIDDIGQSDVLVAFTEPPRSSASRGGRHVEFGYALGTGVKVLIVGHRENVFCWLPWVRYAADWDMAKAMLVEGELR